MSQTTMRKGVNLEELEKVDVLQKIARMKELPLDIAVEKIKFMINEIDNEFARMREKFGRTNA